MRKAIKKNIERLLGYSGKEYSKCGYTEKYNGR